MKKILPLITSLIIVILAVSCNMDSDTGLFQEAGQSVKKESYSIIRVLDEIKTSSIYLVSSDEGFFLYSGKEGKKLTENVGDGNKAKAAVWGTIISDSTWECVYYIDGKYQKIDQSGSVTDYEASNLTGYAPTQSVFENGFTIVVFKNTDSSKYSVTVSKDEPTKWTLVDTGCTNVSYIGDEYFIGQHSEKGNVYFQCNASTENIKIESNANGYITHNGLVFLANTGKFFKVSDNTEIGSVSSKTYTMVPAVSDETNVYFILSGVNNVYSIKTSGDEMKLTTKAVSSLSGIDVVYIAGVVDGEYINVITAESGARCINLHDSRIDSTWK